MTGSTRSYEMAKRLSKAGHEVHIFTSCRTGQKTRKGWFREEIEGFTVHWIHVPYDNTFGFIRRLFAFFIFAAKTSKRCIKEDGDVVFATSTPLTIAIPAVITKKKLSVPMIFEVRDLWPELPIAMGYLKSPVLKYVANLLERWSYSNSEILIGLSPGMCDGIARHGIGKDKIHCIPTSCDIELFDVSPKKGEEFRQKHEWLGDRPLVVYAGTLGALNGVDYMVSLAREMKKINPTIAFVVVGNGSEKESILDYAKSCGVFGENLFMLPAISKRDMPALYSAATVVTSLFIPLEEMWANSANKFFDGLAAGRPIAINYRGWQAELVAKYGNGLVLDNDNIKLSADALNNIVLNVNTLSQMRNSSLSLAKNQYSRDLMAKKLEFCLIQAKKINST